MTNNHKTAGMNKKSLVDTAVEFLKIPEVVNQYEGQKVKFLKNKGLCEKEILEALLKSKESMGSNETLSLATPPLPSHRSLPHHTLWSKMKKTAGGVLFLTSIYFGLPFVYKNYIEPLLTGPKQKTDKASLAQIQESFMTVLNQIQVTLEKMNTSIEEQHKLLKTNSLNNSSHSKKTLTDIQKLLSEMSALKSMFINRQNFAIPPLPSPALPRWQTIQKTSETPTTPVIAEAETFNESSRELANGNAEEILKSNFSSDDLLSECQNSLVNNTDMDTIQA